MDDKKTKWIGRPRPNPDPPDGRQQEKEAFRSTRITARTPERPENEPNRQREESANRSPQTPVMSGECVANSTDNNKTGLVQVNAFSRLMGATMNRSHSAQELTLVGLTKEEEQATLLGDSNETQSDKRVRSPGDCEQASKRAKSAPIMERTTETINELMQLAHNHPTTARKIKMGLQQLEKLIQIARNEFHLMEEKLQSAKNPHTETNENPRNSMTISMGVNEIEELVAKEWPATAYKNTTLNTRDVIPRAQLTCNIVEAQNLNEDKNFLRLTQIVPEAKDLTSDLLMKNGMIVISKNELTTITGIKSNSTKNRIYTVHPAMNNQEGELSTVNLINWCESIKKLAAKEEVKTAECFLPETLKCVIRARKIMECCLYGTDIIILIRPSREQRKAYQRSKNAGKINREALIIRAKEGVSYSEVVKELKQQISPEDYGVSIKGISSTLKGDVKIMLTENLPGAKRDMISKIRSSVSCAKTAVIASKSKGIVIMDLEDDITEVDVVRVLTETLSVDKENVKLNPLRKMRRGTQMVTVFLPAQAAEEAINMRRIKIGWTSCLIKEKIDPPFCTHCKVYKIEGHKCSERSVSFRCFKCGGSHNTQECNNDLVYCFSCQVEGHRANQMKCPVYGKLIRDARK